MVVQGKHRLIHFVQVFEMKLLSDTIVINHECRLVHLFLLTNTEKWLKPSSRDPFVIPKNVELLGTGINIPTNYIIPITTDGKKPKFSSIENYYSFINLKGWQQ